MTPQPTSYDPDNVFAKILDGRLPSYKIFETEHSLAILDAFPTAPGHSLLISKAPVATVMELNEQQAADVLKELPRLCRAVQLATNCDGVNVLHNGGAAAGQIVHHLHFHVLPRFSGDGLFSQPQSAKSMITAEEATAVLGKIRSNL
ncbi:HIT domain-containing protein, putative [Eimeria maxima]|uniref:HIT domain-containing protein, putative n=1 Tax=Eimeria maxima TaxID=5804 RepID=U6MEJ4_EIMMA|nr:HIT domain-containing protein, putative [Eimeria maxima]CDJ60065.1 HIT domain-containing protein, putative [Eimeria maxima]